MKEFQIEQFFIINAHTQEREEGPFYFLEDVRWYLKRFYGWAGPFEHVIKKELS